MTLGVLCTLSFGVLSGYTLFGFTFFDLFDFLASKVLLPLGGIVISLFVGYYLDRRIVRNEITNNGSLTFRLFGLYIFLTRYVVPVAIAAIFVNELFL